MFPTLFGLRKKKDPLIFEHWYALFPDLTSSTTDFYDAVVEELDKQEVPGLDANQVTFSEGGVLTTDRSYLRMRRERIVFDVCSAPFGTSWFFSCRIAEIPFSIRIWELLLCLVGLVAVFSFYSKIFNMSLGIVIFVLTIFGGLFLFNRSARLGNHDLDSIVLKIPVIGALYELAVRRNQTYYREDARAIYCHIVDAVVRAQVEHVAAEHDIEEVRFESVPVRTSPQQS